MRYVVVVMITLALAGCDDAKKVVEKVEKTVEEALGFGWVDDNTEPPPECTDERWPECEGF